MQPGERRLLGLPFAAAILSALAALILKLETFVRSESAKKDIAAAELEHLGYQFLEKNPAEARS